MRTLHQQLIAAAGVLFLAVALSSGDGRILAAGVAAVAIAAVLATQVASIPSSPLVNAQARARAQRTEAQPAPAHPTTAGRPLGRAPTRGSAAA